MDVTLEDFTPYDRSVQWQVHDAFFAQRGAAAWKDGDIPHYATNNYAAARQHAEFSLRLVRDLGAAGELGPREEVFVLEIGSGGGEFCANFFKALVRGGGASGRALAARLRYVLSDYSEQNVAEAIKSERLRELVDGGRVVPALFDLRRPRELLHLDRTPFRCKLAALVSNYVCCVSPLKMLRKRKEGGWTEKYIAVRAEVKDGQAADEAAGREMLARFLDRATTPEILGGLKIETEWRPAALDRLFGDPIHAAALGELAKPFALATVAYPYPFLEMLRTIPPLMKRGGVVLINDYGTCTRSDLEGESERRPQFYGNTLNHAVSFAIFDVFARRAGIEMTRSDNPARSLHTAAFWYHRPPSPALRAAFRKIYVAREEGEDLLDFSAAARACMKNEEYVRAFKLYQRCVELDPFNAELRFRAGEAGLEANFLEHALVHLKRGMKLDTGKAWDFDFVIGRILFRMKEFRRAIASCERSVVRGDNPATRCNMGICYEELGRLREAYASYRKALELDKAYSRAEKLLTGLESSWAAKTLGAPRKPRTKKPKPKRRSAGARK